MKSGGSVSIGRLIGCIHRQSATYFEKSMAPFGLGSGSHFFLMMLYRRDGLSQNRMAEKIHVDKALVARSVKKLMSLGYVRRERDESDGRAYRVYLTEKALALKPHIKTVLGQWSDCLTEGFSPDEKAQALTLLERMANNAVAQREKEQGGCVRTGRE